MSFVFHEISWISSGHDQINTSCRVHHHHSSLQKSSRQTPDYVRRLAMRKRPGSGAGDRLIREQCRRCQLSRSSSETPGPPACSGTCKQVHMYRMQYHLVSRSPAVDSLYLIRSRERHSTWFLISFLCISYTGTMVPY